MSPRSKRPSPVCAGMPEKLASGTGEALHFGPDGGPGHATDQSVVVIGARRPWDSEAGWPCGCSRRVAAAAQGAAGQRAAAPAAQADADDPIRTLVGRLDLEKYKATLKGLTQFGDRRQGTQRNRDAVNWIQKQLESYGYTNAERIKYDPPVPTRECGPSVPASVVVARGGGAAGAAGAAGGGAAGAGGAAGGAAGGGRAGGGRGAAGGGAAVAARRPAATLVRARRPPAARAARASSAIAHARA